MLTIERFAALLDAYGADSRRWPAAERDAALALLAADPRGRVLLAEARALDEALESHPAPQVAHELRASVLAGAPTPSQARRWAAASWARLWAPRAGFAAAGLAGLLFGAVLSNSADPGAATLLAEAEPYDEFVLAEGEAL